MAFTLIEGDPSSGKASTADFQTSCKAVLNRIARSNPAASLVENFFRTFIPLFLMTLGGAGCLGRIVEPSG